MMHRVMLFLLWFFGWMLLSWPPDTKKMVTALFVSLLVSVLTVDILSHKKAGRSRIGAAGMLRRIAWFLLYAAVFLWECLKANIDVAYRVLHPDMPIRPGTIKVKTRLKSDVALTFLANSVTLTPGRTSVDIDKERGFLYIHKLYIKEGDNAPASDAVQKFENILEKIFE